MASAVFISYFRWTLVRPPLGLQVISSAPYGGRRPFNWPSVLVTLGGYTATVLLFIFLNCSAPRAMYHPSFYGYFSILCALPLVACTVWLIAMAHGFPARTTVALGVAMGMVADLMLLQGITLLFHRHPLEVGLNLTFLVSASISLIVLAIGGNAEGVRRQWRDRQAQETDALTGLLNRRGIIRRYGELPPASVITVVMLDLNDLKSVNDLGGHSAGDEHLKKIAQALTRHLPLQALVGRWGGDEFVVVLRDHIEPQEMMLAVQAQILPQDSALSLFAYGATTVTAEVPLERALALADQKMYESKAHAYASRAWENKESKVSLADFPHFLLGLETDRDILQIGLRRAAELAGFEAWFSARQGEHLELTYQELDGGDVRDVISIQSGQQSSVVSSVIERREIIWAADYEHSPYAEPFWVEIGIKSVVAAPVTVSGQVAAVVAFTTRKTWHSVTPQARQLLEAVAVHLGHQLERQAVLVRMQATVEAGISGMGVILEARDLETAGHTARVVAMSGKLGEAAGLNAEQLVALRLGAYLHDVGKLAIPDAVLLKPGALDAEEWALMKTHAARGAAMVSRLPSLSEASLSVVLSHHERWDAQGYPHGLQGENIPLLARIFALCDVYDALVNVRPYKRAWTPQEARDELTAQSGKHFDPHLTTLFLQTLVASEQVPELARS